MVINQLKKANVELVLSLPCDKSKRFTDFVHDEIRTIDLAKEEDGVGIAAGAYLAGTRSVISIQSSGLGNMMNAIMSLTECYRMPLVIMASWRGGDDEEIEAQKHFNRHIPEMLKVFGIRCMIIGEVSEVQNIAPAIEEAYGSDSILVILVLPKLWAETDRNSPRYPLRRRNIHYSISQKIPHPKLTRLEAIQTVMESIPEDSLVVSNIGVPSKEVYAAHDRPLNFYMMGSFGQATPIGLGLALCSDRHVVVIDGDGSLLTNNILPVVSDESLDNLTIVCMDNGTFGSTGHQFNHAYSVLDIGLFALGCGLKDVYCVTKREEAHRILAHLYEVKFLQFVCKPHNSDSPNIDMSPVAIKERFMKALRE